MTRTVLLGKQKEPCSTVGQIKSVYTMDGRVREKVGQQMWDLTL